MNKFSLNIPVIQFLLKNKTHLSAIYFIAVTASLLFTSTLHAQDSTNVNNKPTSKRIEIIEPYKPILNDADKINSNPSIKATDKIIPNLKYNFISKRVPTNFYINPINQPKLKVNR